MQHTHTPTYVMCIYIFTNSTATCTLLHTYIHTYVDTVHTYIRSYCTYIYTYVRTYVHRVSFRERMEGALAHLFFPVLTSYNSNVVVKIHTFTLPPPPPHHIFQNWNFTSLPESEPCVHTYVRMYIKVTN